MNIYFMNMCHNLKHTLSDVTNNLANVGMYEKKEIGDDGFFMWYYYYLFQLGILKI